MKTLCEHGHLKLEASISVCSKHPTIRNRKSKQAILAVAVVSKTVQPHRRQAYRMPPTAPLELRMIRMPIRGFLPSSEKILEIVKVALFASGCLISPSHLHPFITPWSHESRVAVSISKPYHQTPRPSL